jgi:hypothetical protein
MDLGKLQAPHYFIGGNAATHEKILQHDQDPFVGNLSKIVDQETGPIAPVNVRMQRSEPIVAIISLSLGAQVDLKGAIGPMFGEQ